MVSCISSDYKAILSGLIEKQMRHELLGEFVDAIPVCSEVPTVTTATPAAVAEAKKRKVPEPWGITPKFIDEHMKATEFPSLSAVIKHLGIPISGIQCDAEGKKCRAMSNVDILRIKGYIVSGNGEPKKASEGGTKLLVYHPQAWKKVQEKTKEE